MSIAVCCLCVQLIPRGVRKIGISTFFQLFSSSYRDKISAQFGKDDNCEFCSVCAPVIREMEDLRHQMSLLEDQIGAKVAKIRQILLDSSSFLDLDGDDDDEDQIKKLRKIVLQATAIKDEVKSDEEDEIIFPGGDDQIIDHQPAPFSPTPVEMHNEETFPHHEEFEFCIIPDLPPKWPPTPSSTNTTPPRPKRKRGNGAPPPLKKQKGTKRPKNPPSGQEKVTRPVTKEVKILLERMPQPIPTPPTPRPSPETKSQFSRPDSLPEKVNNPEADLETTFKCPTCSKPFVVKASFDRHLSRGCGRGRVHVCPDPTCSFSTPNRRRFERHVGRLHPDVAIHQCPLCEKVFRKKPHRAVHMVVDHEEGEKKFHCEKCDKNFALEENLKRHVKLHKFDGTKPLSCAVCDARFKDEKDREVHVAKSHLGEKPSETCDQCGKTFENLTRHVWRVHAPTKEHVCHVCGKEFGRAGYLKHHLKIHDDSLRPGCDLCGEKFSSVNSVQAHKVKQHGADPCICDECGETFSSMKGLKGHKWRHMGLKPFKCETCDATFPRRGELNSHLRSHSAQRPHPCPHCPKAFKHSHKLRDHLNRYHTPGYVPKLYKCPHCEKSFRVSAALKGHLIRTHTQGGPFPFPCDQCGKGFVFSSLLALHLKRVHSVDAAAGRKKRVRRAKRATTPKNLVVTKALQSIRDKFLAAGGQLSFFCEQCGKGYMVKSTLQRHLKKAHGVLGARTGAKRSKQGRSRVKRKKGVVTTRTDKKVGKKKSK